MTTRMISSLSDKTFHRIDKVEPSLRTNRKDTYNTHDYLIVYDN